MYSQGEKSAFRNTWVFALLLMIAIVFVVNVAFIWLSTQNRSTFVDREYKTKDRKSGAAFVNELGQQQALGWKATMNRPELTVRDEPTLYTISVVDSEGKSIRGDVTVEAYRASDATKDFSVKFAEVTVGQYQGSISFPLKGYWELRIRVVRDGDVFTVRTEKFMVADHR